MRLGIFARTFAGPGLEETLDAVADAGFRTLQFNPALAGGAPVRVRELAARRGLTIAAVSGTYNMAHPDPAFRADGLRRLERIIAAAPALGTSCVTLCTGTRDATDMWRGHRDNGTPEAWADLRAGLAAALAVAERHGVTLGVEPEHHNVVHDAAAARRLLSELASPRLKVVIDPANLFPRGLGRQAATLHTAFALLGDDLVLAHAKDVREDGSVVAAGRGDLDYDLYVSLLDQAPGDVPLLLHGLTEAELPRSRAFVASALARASPPPD